MLRTRVVGTIFAALTCVMLLPAFAWAQSATTGSIAGVVKDATGAVLPGVTVEAASPALIEKVRTVVTDSEGQYKIVELRPGTYSVTFSLAGFSTVRREGIELTTGFTAPANAEMRVGAIEETITVTGASPVVDTQNVSAQKVFSRQVLDALPTGRTAQAYATLTVGATVLAANQDVGGSKGEQWSGIAIHGLPTGDGRSTMDGMTFNNMIGSAGGVGEGRHYFVNQDAVQEVTLETGGMSAASETGGIQMNVVPKDGGNTFKASFNTNGTNRNLQASNLTDQLRARGLTTVSTVKKIYDIGGGLGGPIKQDKLWFYTAHRWWGSQEYAAGNFYNKTQGTPFYTPDFSRQGYTNPYQEDHSLRLTWQASPKHKFTFSNSLQRNCACHYSIDDGTRAPEAAVDYPIWPLDLAQGTWSYPANNRLLFEAGASYLQNVVNPVPGDPGVSPDDISITELSSNLMYNSAAAGLAAGAYGRNDHYGQYNTRFAVSYITGSHAFKVGVSTLSGVNNLGNHEINHAISYAFLRGLPQSLTEWASPSREEETLKLNLGIYAQDQWTLRKLTLNLGVRFDAVNGYVPAQQRPAGQFVQAFDFARIDNVPNFKDLAPRLGAAYDFFGDSKTALKVSLGRYVASVGSGIAQAVNPANAIVTSASRTWNDVNGNYIPDCNLQNPAANGECGALTNDKFGTVNIRSRYAQDVLEGFGVRGYNWQGSASLQHELRPGMALNVGYFRTWFGNFTVTDNLAVAPADYNSYCITGPVDSRLPGGGGKQLCGMYDVSPSKFGQVNNLVTQASNFGKQTSVSDNVEIGINARFGRGGLLSGGVSAGRTVVDTCDIATKHPEVVATMALPTGTFTTGPSFSTQFCRVTLPLAGMTQVKLNGLYPLPWDLQASATFQNLPGRPIGTTYVATSAEIAPSLGRNLSACGATVPCNATAIVTLIEPNTLFEDRLNQLDVRLNKIIKMGRTRVQGMFDVYNVFNASTVLSQIPRYGPTWLRPNLILGARLFKVGVQLDF